MNGLMMDAPLTITSILRHALRNHSQREIVSVTHDHPRHRTTYGEAFARAARFAHALERRGLARGDRVATLAWNDFRHLELYYGVSCSGFVLHTLNPRLFAEQLVYILRHAEDRLLFLDPLFVPLVEKVAPELPAVEGYVVLSDEEHMPSSSLPGLSCYETWVGEGEADFPWPDLDEREASALCYTSGTTGHPKGVLYNHRATVLHALAEALPDVFALSARDSVLPVVPMFHANAWGTPYCCPMVGAKMVFPGPKMGDGEALADLLDEEQVTLALGVPTVWLSLLSYLRESGRTLEHLERTVVGGSACPVSVMDEFQDRHGVVTHHAWGMTEMSPLGTLNRPTPASDALPEDERDALRAKQGRVPFGVEMKVVGSEGDLPWDGETFGALQVRGPWVCSGYFKQEASEAHGADGWFDTGDVATIDPHGFLQITDRTKDVIKSGGEWISSIELENLAVAHPAVAEAAVIGVTHPKWAERPLLLAVKADGQEVSREELLAFFEGKVASWWVPDDVVWVEELPHTATGKINKVVLREQLAGYELPG